MKPIEHIRTKVFRLTQVAFAQLAEVSQSTVSRWESGALEPNRDELQKLREAAKERHLEWSDSLLFEVPSDRESAA